jgi:DNA polymerase-3 subunit epsilon/ATP-dependent DNA helicase DinG
MSHTESGDIDEIGIQSPREREWAREFTAPEDLETAAMCARAPKCMVRESRRRAASSDIIVVNHALLLTHLLTPASVLPDAGAIVIDEAHVLPEVAMRALEHRASPSRFRTAISRVAGGADPLRLRRLGAIADRLAEQPASSFREHLDRLRAAILTARTVGEHFFGELEAKSLPNGDVRYDRRAAESQTLPGSVDALLLAIRDVIEPATRLTEILVRRPPDGEEEEELILSFAAAVGGVGAFLESLRFTVEVPDDGYVYWQERDPEPALVAVPLNPGEHLAAKLLDEHDTVLLTSATLAAGGDFGHFLNRLGTTPEATDTLAVDTPFPLNEQVLALAPPMPAPNHPRYDEAVAGAVADLAVATRRNMLVLLTSHRTLRAVHADLEKRLPRDLTLLGQGIDGDRATVSDMFRRARGAVLLGTSSFFEGVDFPGEELELLVLTRLPFPVPSDPVVAARCADRGVFVILDSRIRSARYRGRFLSALPVDVSAPESLDEAVSMAGEWFDIGAPAPQTFQGEAHS